MPEPGRLRFTLGQSMVVTAIVAVVIYAALSEVGYESFAEPRSLVSSAVRFAGAGVCYDNLRLSRGMWLVFVGYLGEWLVGAATRLTFSAGSSAFRPEFMVNVIRVSWVASVLFSILFVVGLAMAFLDIRRQLVIPEDAT